IRHVSRDHDRVVTGPDEDALRTGGVPRRRDEPNSLGHVPLAGHDIQRSGFAKPPDVAIASGTAVLVIVDLERIPIGLLDQIRGGDRGPLLRRDVGESVGDRPRTVADVVAQCDHLDVSDADPAVRHYRPRDLAITRRWISLVPSTMRSIRT